MKHVGKMKNNGAPVAVAFRTLPGDALSCLVVDTGKLEPTQHDSLMSLIESGEAQGAYELGTVLSTRRFPDGSIVLPYLHSAGVLIKVPTANVIMTSAPQQQVPLNELNKLIAEQRGVSIDDLAITESGHPTTKPKAKEDFTKTTSASVNGEVEEISTPAITDVLDDKSLAKNYRSQADAMFKEAQQLRKQADELDPPATKKTSSKKEIA